MPSALPRVSSFPPGYQSNSTAPILSAPMVEWFTRDVPLSRISPRLSSANNCEVARIARTKWNRSHATEVVTQAALDLSDASIFSGISATDTEPAEEPAKKARKPRSPAPHLEPLPIAERNSVTVKEAATVLPTTPGALRHKIWLASAYASTNYEGMPHIAAFAKCVHRPPGQRRVYLHLPRLLAFFAGQGTGNV